MTRSKQLKKRNSKLAESKEDTLTITTETCTKDEHDGTLQTEGEMSCAKESLQSPNQKVSGKERKSIHKTPVKEAATGKTSDSLHLNVEDNDQDGAQEPAKETQKCPFGKASSTSVNSSVRKVYQILRKSTGALGGNGYDGAIYGELTMHSMQKVIDFLVSTCAMTSKSRFIDVGSGLGKPNFHAAQNPGVRLSIGIELEEIRWKLAMHNLDHFLDQLLNDTTTSPGDGNDENDDDSNDIDNNLASTSRNPTPTRTRARSASREAQSTSVSTSASSASALMGGVNFMCGDIDHTSSTDPFTHIYMYDLGFPPDLQRNIAKKFNSSVHARYLVSYRPAHRIAGEEYGYNVELVGQVPTHMHGSGEVHTAYFYRRLFDGPEPEINRSALPVGTSLVTLPARVRRVIPMVENEEDEEVICSDAFKAIVEAAAGDASALSVTTKALVASHMTAGRPQRTRRQRAL